MEMVIGLYFVGFKLASLKSTQCVQLLSRFYSSNIKKNSITLIEKFFSYFQAYQSRKHTNNYVFNHLSLAPIGTSRWYFTYYSI